MCSSDLGDIRNRFPRFNRENQADNQKLVARLREIASSKGITQVQLAMAWVLAKRKSIIPVMGARKRTQLAESLAALDLKFTPEEISAIEAAIPPSAIAGTRYEEQQMRVLDSEK